MNTKTTKWLPICDLSELQCYNGDQFLLASEHCIHGKTYINYSVVTVCCDSDHFHLQCGNEDGEELWEGASYYAPLSEFGLSVIQEAAQAE